MKQVPRDRKPNIVKYKTLATYELNNQNFGFVKLDVIMTEIMKPHGKASDKFKTVYTLIRVLTNGQGLPINHLSETTNKAIKHHNEAITKINPEIPFPVKLYKEMAILDYGKCFTKKVSPEQISEILKGIEDTIKHWEYILSLDEYNDQYLGVQMIDGKEYHVMKTLTVDGWLKKCIDTDTLEVVKATFADIQQGDQK